MATKFYPELHIYSELDKKANTITRTIKNKDGEVIYQCITNLIYVNPYINDPVCLLEHALQNDMSNTASSLSASQSELSDAEIRLRTLELVYRSYHCCDPFELIARSIALARYIKSGKYTQTANSCREINDEFVERIYDELTEKRYEPKQATDDANNKASIPNQRVPFFKKLLFCFRNK